MTAVLTPGPGRAQLAWAKALTDAVNAHDDAIASTPWAKVVGGVRAESGSPYLTAAIGATETDVSQLAITGKTALNAHLYAFVGTVKTNNSTAADSFYMRVRLGSALTGTEIVSAQLLTTVAGFDHSNPFAMFWRCTADNASADFRLSMQRVAGGGTIRPIGASLSHWVLLDVSTTSFWSIT